MDACPQILMIHGKNKAQAGQDEHADIRTDLSQASQRAPRRVSPIGGIDPSPDCSILLSMELISHSGGKLKAGWKLRADPGVR